MRCSNNCFVVNAGTTNNPTKTATLEQKMGLPPAHAKTMSDIRNPVLRRKLPQIICGHIEQG